MLSAFAGEMITATLIQYTAGAYVKGVWVPGTPSTSSISIIAPQPVTPEEKQMLPSGEIDKNHLRTWTEIGVSSWGPADPDKLIIDGKTYKISMISDRSRLGNYCKLFIYEEKENE